MNSFPPEIQASGTGPIPPAYVLSDRSGEVLVSEGCAAPLPEPAARVITMFDVNGGDAPGPERSSRSSRREQILDAAEELFRENGYHGSSLRDISGRAGISHPGMLHHFASKDALLGGVVDRLEAHAQGLLDRTEQIGGGLATVDAEFGGRWSPRHPMVRLLATLSAEAVSPDHPGRFRVARLRRVHEHIAERVLRAFDERGALRLGLDVEFASRALVGTMLALAVRDATVRPLQRQSSVSPVVDLRDQFRLYLAVPGAADAGAGVDAGAGTGVDAGPGAGAGAGAGSDAGPGAGADAGVGADAGAGVGANADVTADPRADGADED